MHHTHHSLWALIWTVCVPLLQESGPSELSTLSKLYPLKAMSLLSCWVTHTCGQGWLYEHTKMSLSSHQHILCYSPIQVGNVCAAMLSSSTPHQRAAIALRRGYGLSQPTMPQCPWWMTAQKLSPIFFRHPLLQHGSMQGTAPWRAESIQRMCRKTSLRCGVHNFT